jgi:ribonuclease BN (tRNA processing enzyme)
MTQNKEVLDKYLYRLNNQEARATVCISHGAVQYCNPVFQITFRDAFIVVLRAFLLIVTGVLLGEVASAQTWYSEPPEQTTVVLLGTGIPFPDPHRSGPATAIVVGERIFLFDAGPGVMGRISAADLPVDGPTAVFFTHLHTDHTVGYPDLIFTTWGQGRSRPLKAFGPRGLRSMTEHLLAAYAEDVRVRSEGLQRQSAQGYEVDAREIAPGVVYDSAGVRITAIAVAHGDWPQAFAYRLDAPDRSVVISGDTRPNENLLRGSRDLDVLVHSVYGVLPSQRRSAHRYFQEYHTSSVELGELAAKVAPKLLLLTHIIYGGKTEEDIIAGIRRGGFDGSIVVARDLDRY